MGTCTITYNGAVISESNESDSIAVAYDYTAIATMVGGENKTLNCANKYMKTDITIGGKTLKCGGTIMAGDVNIDVKSNDPVSYIIYESGSSAVNYGTLSDGGSQDAGGEGSYGYSIGTECIEAYCGEQGKNKSGVSLSPSYSTIYGYGKWKLTVDTSQIIAPGILYITTSRNEYSGSSTVKLNGSIYYSDYGWELSVSNSNGTALMNQVPPTSEYTYSCNIDNPADGVIIRGEVALLGTKPINMYVTKIEYIANAAAEDDSAKYAIFGDGKFGEGFYWKSDRPSGSTGSEYEEDLILQIVDSTGSGAGKGIVTFLDNGEDIGFDFTDYNKLNIQTTKVIHQNTTSMYVCYVSYGKENAHSTLYADGYKVLTAHTSGTITDSIDISGVSGRNFIHIVADDVAYISKVWLSK